MPSNAVMAFLCTMAWKGHTLQFTAVTFTMQASRLQLPVTSTKL